VVAEADAAGAKVTLHMARGSRASSLYERLGFREVGGDEVYALLERDCDRGATRRQVLQAGAAGGVALWLAGGPSMAWAGPGTRQAASGDGPHLRRSSWTGLVGTDLPLDGDGRLRLEAVSDGSEDAFALLFSGSAGAPVEQGIHRFRMAGGAEAELFLVPVGAPAARPLYEVVVDRSLRLARIDPPRPPATPAGAIAPAAAPASTAASAPAGAGPAPDRRYAFLETVTMRRGRPGLRAELRLARKGGMRSVTLRVSRNGVVYGRGRGPVRGRKALVGLRLLAPLPRGRYDVVVEGVDRSGIRTAVRRSVMIR
jgi:hypothetical protein